MPIARTRSLGCGKQIKFWTLGISKRELGLNK